MTLITGIDDRSKNTWDVKVQNKTDPFFERKLDSAIDGLPPFYKKCIINLLYENAKLVVDFINSEVQYNNIKVSSKKNKIQGITA